MNNRDHNSRKTLVYKNKVRNPASILVTGILAATLVALLLFVFVPKVSTATTGESNVVASATVNAKCFITWSNTAVAFGNIDPTQAAATSNLVVGTDTDGNAATNVLVAGGNWVLEYDTTNYFVQNTLWNPTSAGAGVGNVVNLYNGLFSSLEDTNILITAPTQSNPTTTNNIFFGAEVPGGTPSGIYVQNVVLSTACNTLTTNVVMTVNVQSYCFISLSNTAIGFGAINPGSNVGTTNVVTVSDPGGNVAANILVDGSNWISGANNFYVANTVWNPTSSATYVGNNLKLDPSGLTDTNIQITAPTLSTPTQSASIYFGLAVPGGQAAGTYTQNIVLENKC